MAPVTHTGPSSPAVPLGTTKVSTKLMVFARCVQNHPDLSRLLQKDMREITQDVCQLVTGQLPTVERAPNTLQQIAGLVKAALAELRSEKKSIFALTIQKIHEIDEIAHAHATGVLYKKLRAKRLIPGEPSSNVKAQRAAIAAVNVAEVTTLDLSNKGLRCVPRELSRFTALQTLWLHHNQLTALPDGVFNNLTALTDLYLTHNQLSYLPPGIFDSLTALRTLYLNQNQLRALPPGIFDSLTALRMLVLNYNQLTSLPPGIFDNLTVLRTLYLMHNQLTSLPDKIFDNLSGLHCLYLDHNHLISLLAHCFDNLTALEELGLRGNPLKERPLLPAKIRA